MAISDEKFKAHLNSIQRMLDKMDAILENIPEIQQKIKEYSVKKQNESQDFLFDKATSTPMIIPISHKTLETQNEAIQRILLASGAITREQFESALGVSYDGDFSDEDEVDVPYSVDEDFKQSRFASYVEVPNVETKTIDKATAVKNEQSQVASDNGDNGGAATGEENVVVGEQNNG
jgi:hypothetical protein